MTDPFERFKAMICLYQSRVSGYADHFLLDQVNAMPDSELLLRHPPLHRWCLKPSSELHRWVGLQ